MSKKSILVARENDLSEAISLADTIRLNIVKKLVLRNNYRPDRNYFLNLRLLNEVKNLLNTLNSNKVIINSIYIYEVLHPRQVVNLIKELKLEVRDKILMVLEIFADHAGSKEAKLQIEMAEITYQLPIVKEWIRKAKLGELPGFMGPGEYATETYYNHMKRKLIRIRKNLNELRTRRRKERELRVSKGFPHVAISGYANAGKTTLFNSLTKLNKPTGPEMFTTISPKAALAWIDCSEVVFVDTVGFIRDLPPEVIEAFYATLEEVSLSDLAVLVLDSSEPPRIIESKLRTSLNILSKIGYFGKPLVIALNKIDLSNDLENIENLVKQYMTSNYLWSWRLVKVSALRGEGLSELKKTLCELLSPRISETSKTSIHKHN
ncbi:MAG: GTPase HflX [Desulfurococcaceae archaeon TW002]